jgi:anaphase-promoting complex subunit 2
LLHAGATTTSILNVYVYIIRAFSELEPNGVLLERAARPIRRYLKGREDTARIIISSLLTDVEDEHRTKFGPASELSYEIAAEMQKPIVSFAQEQDDDLNWGDMKWQPHPMDASPDYRKSKVEDVIWFLLTLYDREDFINELKQILGDYLLRGHDPEYEKETRLLELIKLRLGDDKLQACEVMLRDVFESNRINASINGEKKPAVPSTPLPIPPSPHAPSHTVAIPHTPTAQAASTRYPPPSTPIAALSKPASLEHTLNAQILSSFFWPPLREDAFHVPAPIATLQGEYEARFERVKGMRKLRWLPSLGRAKVELHLADRTVETEVQTWQASVIYAFQPLPAEAAAKGRFGRKEREEGLRRDVPQLGEMLEMEEAQVRNALVFWVGMEVLREVETDVYQVLETLPKASPTDSTATNSAADPPTTTAVVAAAAAAAAEMLPSAVVSATEQLAQNKPLYRQFVMGMLTNQGNMPPARVLMMLKMVVPGGFPYGVEEVRALLEELVEEGKVGGGGDVFGVRK